MKTRSLGHALAALILVLGLGVVALGDVIRMKDGQVIRGQIVAFRDQQFTVLIGSGAGGRRSRITLYMEDVDSIEFESAGAADAGAAVDDGGASTASNTTARPAPEARHAPLTPRRSSAARPR